MAVTIWFSNNFFTEVFPSHGSTKITSNFVNFIVGRSISITKCVGYGLSPFVEVFYEQLYVYCYCYICDLLLVFYLSKGGGESII